MLYSDLGDNPLSTLRAIALQVLRLVAHFCPLMPSNALCAPPKRRLGKQSKTTDLSRKKKTLLNSSPKLLSDVLYTFAIMEVSKSLGIPINYKFCIWEWWIDLSLCHCIPIFIVVVLQLKLIIGRFSF